MNTEAFKYMKRMPHFSFLPEEEIDRLARVAVTKEFSQGEVLAKQGETLIDHIYVIARGQLSVHDEKNKENTLTGHIKKGEVFGGITILMNAGISLRTILIDEFSRFHLIPKNLFLDICARYKQFYQYFLKNFSRNIFDSSLSKIIEFGQARQFISNLEPFSFLKENEIKSIASKFSIVHYPANTILFVQGVTRVSNLYILLKGSAERYFEEAGKKTMSGMLAEGDLYGGISMLLNDGISVRTLQIREDSSFYILSKNDFFQICDQYKAVTEFFTDTFGKRMLNRSYASIIAKTLKPKDESLQFFNQPVSRIYDARTIFCAMDTPVQQSAVKMRDAESSFILIESQDKKPKGIVTERDITRKVLAAGYDPLLPVADIMSSPLHTISDQALVFEAFMAMMQEDIRHLAVTNADDRIVGVISNRDILSAQGQSPLFLIREITAAKNIQEIIDRHEQLPRLVQGLISNGANAKNVTRFITAVSDAILKKLMVFTIDAIGEPPARFAFMILGSEGRNEQTLKTDQDNAIIYDDIHNGDESSINDYFLRFGEKACELLDMAGYTYCTGDVMAKNPRWCQPLRKWKNYFSSWIHAAGAEDLLQASIFFDFRFGYGNNELVEELRGHLMDSLGDWSGFFRYLTENALHFKPPIGFFRNFVVESKGEHRNAFDIKSAMMPIVDFARIFALKYKIDETNTLDRLNQLRVKQVISHEEYEELEKAYNFLMQLRFVRQITSVVDENSEPDNYINPKKLTRIEQTMLKEIFKRIEKFQVKLNFEFVGIA